jgi:hypothetical protein
LGIASAEAGTNFPALKEYPAPSCVRPVKPASPGQATVQVTPLGPSGSVKTVKGDVKDYNKQVAAYNTALHDYTNCMRDYVANAQTDLDAIRDKVNKAVVAAQAPDGGAAP